jgi:hypothetical protein
MMTEDTFESVQSDPEELHYAPIYWHLDSLGDKKPEKTSVFVPVKVNGISENLYMQFDLGSTITGFYGETLKALQKEYSRLDTHMVKGKKSRYFADASIKINKNTSLKADRLYLWENMGQNNLDTTLVKLFRDGESHSSVILGTMGYDMIGDQILILDFKKDRYALTNHLPSKIQEKIEFIEGADVEKYPVLLPLRFGKRRITLIYDTGAGNSPIMTGTNRLKRLTSDSHPLRKVGDASRFGEEHNLYKVEDTRSLRMDGFNYGKVDAYGLKIFNKLWLAGVYGFTGNYFFKDCIVVIDRKNNRFGIIR